MSKEQYAQHLTDKYTKYIENLEWHIKMNNPADVATIRKRIGCYQEMIDDLKPML